MKTCFLEMIKECLVYSFMRLGVTFISPRQLGAVESNPGRLSLPSVDWCTGQSGADFFPILAQPTIEGLELLAHRTLSGAHRTVRCPHQTVGLATRHTRIARPTVGSPDSLVHHRTVRWIIAVRRCWVPESSLFTRASLAHRTLSGAPPDTVRCTQTEQSLGCSSQVFSICLFCDSNT
jgi:hypothetical protein